MKTYSYPIQIRFNDLDAYQHVNNAIYLTYFEEARKSFFQELIGTNWNWSDQGILIVHQDIDYKAPLKLSDDARCKIWFSALGTKSFEISYLIAKFVQGNRVETTSGRSVLVAFDHTQQKSIHIPEDWRKQINLALSSTEIP